MKYGKIIEGDVIIKVDDNNDYSSVQEIIDKTKGQYNHELLVKFFEGK